MITGALYLPPGPSPLSAPTIEDRGGETDAKEV